MSAVAKLTLYPYFEWNFVRPENKKYRKEIFSVFKSLDIDIDWQGMTLKAYDVTSEKLSSFSRIFVFNRRKPSFQESNLGFQN